MSFGTCEARFTSKALRFVPQFRVNRSHLAISGAWVVLCVFVVLMASERAFSFCGCNSEPEQFEVVSLVSQVVAGTIFRVKIKTSADRCAHAKIIRFLPHTRRAPDVQNVQVSTCPLMHKHNHSWCALFDFGSHCHDPTHRNASKLITCFNLPCVPMDCAP